VQPRSLPFNLFMPQGRDKSKLFAAPIGFRMNGEMSQNTALAGLLSRDTQMRELAGDLQWVLLTPSSLRLTAR
jgi:hypothetical protein